MHTELMVPASWGDLLRNGNFLKSIAVTGGVALHATNVYLVTTILPSVVSDIGGLGYYAWNTTLFIVASIIGSALTSKLLSSYSARRAYLLALGIFAAGSILCASASNMPWLLLGRTVQGLGGGILAALGYALIRTLFEPRLWARAIALVCGMWGVATLLGPALGGIFAEAGHWRLAFWALLPVLLFQTLVVVLKLSDEPPKSGAAELIPVRQIILLTASALAIAMAGQLESNSGRALALLLGIGLALVMVWVDKRESAPLLPDGAYSARQPLGQIYICIGLLMIALSPEIFVPYFLQIIHGHSPLIAGYITATMAAGWSLASLFSSGCNAKIAAKLVRIGPLLVAISLAALAWLMPVNGNFPPVTETVLIIIALIGAGFGVGLCWPHLLTRVLQLANPAQENLASSAITSVQLYAMAVGAALAGLVSNAAGISHVGGVAGASNAAYWLLIGFAVPAFGAYWLVGRIRRE